MMEEAAAAEDAGAFDAVEGHNVFASYDTGKTRFEVRFVPGCAVSFSLSLSLSRVLSEPGRVALCTHPGAGRLLLPEVGRRLLCGERGPLCFSLCVRVYCRVLKHAFVAQATMYAMFRNLYFLYSAESKDGGAPVTKKAPFLRRWIMDPHKRQYEDIVCDPDNKDPRLLNTWRGFRAAALPPIGDPERVRELVAPILQVVRLWGSC